MLWWLLRGKAALKAAVGSQTQIDAASLPYHPALLTYLRDEKQSGRRIILATAAHRSIQARKSTAIELELE